MAEVKLLFGYAWGNEYKNWTPFQISLKEIANEIKRAEDSGFGTFGDDNLHLLIDSENIEILFCHEMDIHLSFNETNKLIANILRNWKEKGIYLTEI